VSSKTKTKAAAAILDEPTPAPLAGPQTEGEWIKATYAAMKRKDASPADRAEYRKLLELYPDLSKDHGELPKMYRMFALEMFQGQPILEESVKHRLKVMRAELAGPTPSALEVLLVDVVLSAYQDYWHFAMVMKQKTAQSFTLHEMPKWEHLLASKETRYLRAIGELARIRRLLNLPASQVNINMPGGQQVNVQGDVKPS
jgi:hypothetical protein